MNVIFILIPLSVLIASCFLIAFVWAIRSGQYEDTCTPGMRLLIEEKQEMRSKTRQETKNEHRLL